MKHRAPAWRATEAASLNARQVLPKMLKDYFKTGRKLDRESGAKDMHGFRLKTKHLRYTLEAFIATYGPAFKLRIDSLRPIQNALGDLNDCEVLLAEWDNKLPHAVKAHIKKRAGEKQKEFLQYWRETFDAADEDKKWVLCLTRSSPRKPTK
jgi:CHAD domain-containing protein